jgi:flavoprotein
MNDKKNELKKTKGLIKILQKNSRYSVFLLISEKNEKIFSWYGKFTELKTYCKGLITGSHFLRITVTFSFNVENGVHLWH